MVWKPHTLLCLISELTPWPSFTAAFHQPRHSPSSTLYFVFLFGHTQGCLLIVGSLLPQCWRIKFQTSCMQTILFPSPLHHLFFFFLSSQVLLNILGNPPTCPDTPMWKGSTASISLIPECRDSGATQCPGWNLGTTCTLSLWPPTFSMEKLNIWCHWHLFHLGGPYLAVFRITPDFALRDLLTDLVRTFMRIPGIQPRPFACKACTFFPELSLFYFFEGKGDTAGSKLRDHSW